MDDLCCVYVVNMPYQNHLRAPGFKTIHPTSPPGPRMTWLHMHSDMKPCMIPFSCVFQYQHVGTLLDVNLANFVMDVYYCP